MAPVPYLHADDLLARAVEWAGLDAEVPASELDEEFEQARSERVLAEQLELAGRLPGLYDEATGAAVAGEAGDETLGLGLRDAAGQILAQVEALEADRSRLDGRIVDAYAALHTVLGELVAGAGQGEPVQGVTAGTVSVAEMLVAEVATACAVPGFEVARRLRLAVAGRDRYGQVRARLAAGQVSLLHAGMIAEAVEGFGMAEGLAGPGLDEVAAAVTRRVLAPLPDGSRPGHALIRDRLRRVLRSLQDPGVARERRSRAVARRGLSGQLTEEGMGVLSLHTGAEQVVAVLDRVEHLARALRQAGDPRTLDQLRADLATEALLRHGYGPCEEHADHAASPTGTVTTDTTKDLPSDAEPRVDARAAGAQSCGCAPAAPPASVWIVVPFEVAAGLSDAACELPGHGWVTAEHARELITAPGSVWRWLGVDRVSGQALELGTDRYRPTAAMVEQVRALDGRCRAPGCLVPARACDIDHHVPYPQGPTTVSNTGPLHRGHHRAKTLGLWTCTRAGAGLDTAVTLATGATLAALAARTGRGLAWRTLSGREYVTYPKSWTEALHDPSHPEHTPPSRRRSETRAQRRARLAAEQRARPDWNDPPPF